MKVKRTLLSTVCCLALVLTAIPIGLMAGAQTYASGAAAEQAMHVVTADDVRVSSRNNATEYVWPIDFAEDDTGARMTYHLQASGAPANSAGAPYMQNLNPISQLDGAHLKLTLHNDVSTTYGDTNFMARKFVIKLANQPHQNGATNDLRYTFCVNNADAYIDVMNVTAENVATQRYSFSGHLDKFGDAVSTYDIVFRVRDDSGLTMKVNGIEVNIATAELIASTSTNLSGPVYLYIAADTDYTDITLNSFHGGEEECYNPVAELAAVSGADTMTDYALGNVGNTDPFLIRTDITGGGVHIKQTWGGAQYPYLYRENMQPLDGLTLRFGNYTSADKRPLAIYLAQYQNQWFYGVLPTLLLDPIQGDLKLIRNIDNGTFTGGQYAELATLLTNNALIKSIGSGVFDVSLHRSADGAHWIVKITSGLYAVAGQFDAAVLDALGNGPTTEAAYVSFGNVDNNATNFEVDFYGYTHTPLGNVTIGDAAGEVIDNSKLMPAWQEQSATVTNGNLQTPAWLESAIIAEVNLAKATPAGTIDAATSSILDYYQEMGVNCLWIDPVSQKGDADGYDNGYTNIGIDTIEPELTGTADYAAGWSKLANFVAEAHRRNIRVILDVVIWGVSNTADTTRTITVGGTQKQLADVLDSGDHSGFGGPKYAYNNATFQQWYTESVLNIVNTCDLDGLRVDLEPTITGYTLFDSIRTQAAAAGKQLVILAEHTSNGSAAYDADQMGCTTSANWEHDIYTNANTGYFTTGGQNIVDGVKNGTAANDGVGNKKYYLYTYRTHDNWYKPARTNADGSLVTDASGNALPGNTTVTGSLLDLGYNALFSPYIPVVYMGEATNDRVDAAATAADPSLYYHGHLNLKALLNGENRAYYETVKKYISIRRTYTDIFESFADDHRNSNIAAVSVSGLDSYPAYVRYANSKAVVIVPNDTAADAAVEVSIPDGIGLGSTVTVTDLLTEETVSAGAISSFRTSVAAGSLGIYLIDDGSVLTTGCEKTVRGEGLYAVKNADLRANATDTMAWPIDFTADANGVRMAYHLYTGNVSNNGGSGPYMNNFNQAVSIDGAHLTFTINNPVSESYGDGNFMARKVVFKLANAIYRNGSANDLYYTLCINDADPYVDVMNVTGENVDTQRVYIRDAARFGNAVTEYDLYFTARDGGLVLTINGVEVATATAALLQTTETDITQPIYLYCGAAFDYTDLTLKAFHGGDTSCSGCNGSVIGNVNGDNAIDIRDLVALDEHLNGMGTAIVQANADVNGDSRISPLDRAALRRQLLRS